MNEMELIEIIEEVLMLQEEQKNIEIEVQNYFKEIKYIENLALEIDYIQQKQLDCYELWKECY
jgi:sulfur relay (sulfurtransferase) DsrF/TusC family protein